MPYKDKSKYKRENQSPERLEELRRRDRDRWARIKDNVNPTRRVNKNLLNDMIMDENDKQIKDHDKVVDIRAREKYERFTDEYVDELTTRILDWFSDNKDEPFVYQFFFDDEWGKEQIFWRGILEYLSGRSETASYNVEKVRTIQEMRLLKMGLSKTANAGMVEFFLINKAGYHSKNQKTVTNNKLEIKEGGRIQLLPPSKVNNINNDTGDDNNNNVNNINNINDIEDIDYDYINDINNVNNVNNVNNNDQGDQGETDEVDD